MARVTTLVLACAVLAGVAGHESPSPGDYRIRTVGAPLDHVAVISDSYTTGTREGGLGANAWTVQAWQALRHQGVQVAADVAAEGRAGYGAPGDHGNVFRDLTVRAVRPDDVLVVFFGSRNDQDIDPAALAGMAHDTFDLARRTAPGAKLLVIGPAWPTADVPGSVLAIRDTLGFQAFTGGAVFVDPIAEGWFVGRPELIGADGVHPTDAGHAFLAGKIAALIKEQLPARV